MKSHPHLTDELLSASHDGELTPHERTDVKSLLAESPAARETLEDYRELSTLLQSLRRQPAPAGLQTAVLRRVNELAPRVRGGMPRGRSLMLRAVALCIAASILVMLWFGGQEPQQWHVTGGPPADRDRDGLSGTPVAIRAAESERRVALNTPAPSAAIAGVAADMNDGVADRLQLKLDRPPAHGEFLAYLDRVGEETVIVELVVLDVDRTAQDMLVLLRRRGVQVVDTQPLTSAALPTAAQPAADAEQLVAVYVEGTDAELAGMFDDLASEVKFEDATAHNADVAAAPLASRLASLEEPAQTVVPSEAAPRRETARTESASHPRRDPPAAGAPPAVAPATPPSPAVASTPPPGEEEPREQRAVRVSLPGAFYRRLEERSDDEPAAKDSVAENQTARSPASAPLATADVPADPSPPEPRRVLFVLHRVMP
jgi:anti-sigma factor RsiW